MNYASCIFEAVYDGVGEWCQSSVIIYRTVRLYSEQHDYQEIIRQVNERYHLSRESTYNIIIVIPFLWTEN